jgi:hypothetical protein
MPLARIGTYRESFPSAVPLAVEVSNQYNLPCVPGLMSSTYFHKVHLTPAATETLETDSMNGEVASMQPVGKSSTNVIPIISEGGPCA